MLKTARSPKIRNSRKKRSFVVDGFWVAARKPHHLNPLTILTAAIFGSNFSESNSPTHSFMPLCSS